ncbi:hypothetical protein [Desulfofustis limnaeus]|uniref:Uncharacterized protein n=1 Tax=Desulfofustis limnaeus TaxID=2740163 RepID=A0ABM7WD30_9BACT|nr:hypothetical protein [Desulfofustis limnaeus]BDD88863.1 hypothetical protein DPPLL_32280 [Desulfofustis limnaeus]
MFLDSFCVCFEGIMAVKTNRHKLAGTVTVDGTPAKRNVLCLERDTMAYVGATVSDANTGAWMLYGLPEYPERSLIVFALDTTGNYNAEVADYVTQVATAPAE